jgi:acetyl-CoA carboxylase carboxyl transferase subunit alpha
VDDIVSEPLGGAHRDPIKTGENLKGSIIGHLTELKQLEIEELLAQRYTRLQEFGQFNESA